MARKRIFKKIEMDSELQRWYNSVKRGSVITADVNLRRMEAFCSIMKTDPHAMLELSDKDLTDLIDDFVTEMEDKSTPNYISSILKGVKSWLAFIFEISLLTLITVGIFLNLTSPFSISISGRSPTVSPSLP